MSNYPASFFNNFVCYDPRWFGEANLLRDIPFDIQLIVKELLMHRMEVSGPKTLWGKMIYFVNGYALSENELRLFSQKIFSRALCEKDAMKI